MVESVDDMRQSWFAMDDYPDRESKLKGARVLVVEDDKDYADWIELALTGLGVTKIVKATDGNSALRITQSEPDFDLIICDWVMPNMDGLDFLKRYREKVSTSMFLVLTTKAGLEDAFEITQAGATNFLVKPLSIDEFQSQVSSMI
jgi:DNA-binding response OmpR family regulator